MSQSENTDDEEYEAVGNPLELEIAVLKKDSKYMDRHLAKMTAYLKQLHGFDPLDERSIEFLSQPNPPTSENESSLSTSRQQAASSPALNHQQQILSSKPQDPNSICSPQPSPPATSNPPLPSFASAASNRPIKLPLQFNFPFTREGSITLPRRWARAGQNRDGQNTRTTYFNNRQMQQYTRGGRNSFRRRGG
ncbi:hypothetical protein PV325_010298, partial [Microctonus aethiopoides]